MDYEYVSWESIHNICLILADEIKISYFKPDIVLGIARGGWPIARIIAEVPVAKRTPVIEASACTSR